MKIGVVKEIKNQENRVGLVPSSVFELTKSGHEVYVETNAGFNIGFDDASYKAVGAQIAPNAASVFDQAELIVKVKEPQQSECSMLKPHHTLFTFLHLAPDPEQAQALMKSGCTAIAYETVTDARGGLPLLAPMSEIAGRVSIQVAARLLEQTQGGPGILIGGACGVTPAHIAILGGGIVGSYAARVASGMGARVTLLERSPIRLRELDSEFHNSSVTVMYANSYNCEQAIISADAVIGAVLVTGASAPRLVTRAQLNLMKPGAIMVDVAIDQGGCFESSKPTSHSNPTYVEGGITHYAVTNMPGAVARTSSIALNNATLPHVINLANMGSQKACINDPHLGHGVNVVAGVITHKAVADALGFSYTPPQTIWASAA